MTVPTQILKLISGIKNDTTHGASELARQAISTLKIAAEQSRAATPGEFLAEQRQVGEKLMSTRPAMAPLYNLVNAMLQAENKCAATNLDSLRSFTLKQADRLIQDSLKAVERIAELGAGIISDNDKILTHSFSSTVVAVLKRAAAQHKDLKLTVTRSAVGERTIRELSRTSLKLTLIDDTAAARCLQDIHKVLVGADRICSDSTLINGVGTYQMALLASQFGVPVYVCCETLKFDTRLSSQEVELKERNNPVFDVTPLGLVKGIVTEQGILTPEEAAKYFMSSRAA